MKQINELQEVLLRLGRRLRAVRLERNDSMAVFAERLGVSERTVRQMERGSATVQIGAWIGALWVLDRLTEIERVLEPQESLLDRARSKDTLHRRRASRRRQ